MATLLKDNFNSYDDNPLDGQGSWVSDENFDIQAATVYEGAKAVKIKAGATSGNQAYKLATGVTTGSQSFAFRSAGTDSNLKIELLGNAAGVGVYVIITTTGKIQYYTTGFSTGDIQNYSANTWYVVDVEWRVSDKKARYRVNAGDWTDWLATPDTSWSTIDKVNIKVGVAGFTSDMFIDTFEDVIYGSTSNFFMAL